MYFYYTIFCLKTKTPPLKSSGGVFPHACLTTRDDKAGKGAVLIRQFFIAV